MEDSKNSLSAEEIKANKLFEGFDIEFEEVLNELFIKSMIKKEMREYKLKDGETLINEKVYSV
jgi:hypothetical protein